MAKGQNEKCLKGKVVTLIHYGWKGELIQPFCRGIWNYAQKDIQLCILISQEIRGKGKRSFMFQNMDSSSLCGGKALEIERMSIRWRNPSPIVACDCDGLLIAVS